MKRKLSLLFALIMIAQMTACSESPVQEETQAAAESSLTADDAAAESEIVETVPEETFPELTTLPEGLNYEGYEIKIYSFDHSRYKWEHVADELTGEALNDAIFYRNSNTAELLDVKITAIINKWDNNDFRTKVTAAVMSGADDYDIITGNTYNSTYLSAEGYYYNVNEMPYIDPVNSMWWNESCWRELSVGDRAYMLMGDMCASNYAYDAIFFNKELVASYGFENPYTLVYEDRWYLDTLIEMTQDFYHDLNGNGERDEEDDLYGFYGRDHSICNTAYYYVDITNKTADNNIEVIFNSERTEEITTKLKDWIMNTNGFYTCDGWTPYEGLVEWKNCLFSAFSLNSCSYLREYDVNYGILPFPKYDELDENYTTVPGGVVISFPASASNIERSAAVADCLSYYGRKLVYPAYVENTIMIKGVRDEDAQHMVEIILDNVVFDFGKEFSSFEGYGTFMLDFMLSEQGYSSFHRAMSRMATRELEQSAKKILELEQ